MLSVALAHFLRDLKRATFADSRLGEDVVDPGANGAGTLPGPLARHVELLSNHRYQPAAVGGEVGNVYDAFAKQDASNSVVGQLVVGGAADCTHRHMEIFVDFSPLGARTVDIGSDDLSGRNDTYVWQLGKCLNRFGPHVC